MEDRRVSDGRFNGIGPGRGEGHPRNSSITGATSRSRQDTSELESIEFSDFRLTTTLAKAMYEFGRVKEAQYEFDQANGDHARQQQYFENNPKLKEALETRLKKADRNVNSALLEYAKVARDTEPMLREFASERGSERVPDEESIRRIVRAEFREEIRERRNRGDDFVSYRSLDSKLTDFDRKQQSRLSADIRAAIHKETAGFARKDDVEILSDKVKGMNPRERKTSVTSDIRETDQRIVAHAREIESLKAELAARTNRQRQEFSSLKDRVDGIHKESAAQQTSRIQIRGAQTDDIVKVESALEKAQEVINDQYITIQDLQFQVTSVLEGIRILNGRVEEYDKRFDAVQESMQIFYSEVQAENNKRNTVVMQALDTMYDKIAGEVTAKTDSPISPAIPQFGSPRLDTRPQFANNGSGSPVNSNQFNAINLQLENQAKMIRNIHGQVSTLQNSIAAVQHQAANNIPPLVQSFCDDVSSHMAGYQRDQALAVERIRGLGNTITTMNGSMAKHVANSDNNFRETAMHMDSVKKRFAEHRKQLDNLITAWRETMLTTDELTVKFESLKEFLSVKVVPTIGKWSKVVPGLIEGNLGNVDVNQSSIGSTTNPTTTTGDKGGRNVSTQDGDGGANNPIEL